MAALERVEVVEADGQYAAEASGDLRPEDRRTLLRHEQLEADLEVAEEDPRFRRDQLVRPREVRGGRLHSEPPAQPLAAPRAGEERRARAKRSAREHRECRPQSVASDRPRLLRIGQVEITVDAVQELLLVAVLKRPVHVRIRRSSASRWSRFGKSAYQSSSCGTSALPGPKTTARPDGVGRSWSRSASVPAGTRSNAGSSSCSLSGRRRSRMSVPPNAAATASHGQGRRPFDREHAVGPGGPAAFDVAAGLRVARSRLVPTHARPAR